MPAGGRAERVTKINDDLRKANLTMPEIYRYMSFDKTEIEAALYRPAGKVKDAHVPLVVLIHGGPTGRFFDGFGYIGWPQLLVSRGFAVFCPNIRGSTGYGWSFLAKNRGDWGGDDFKDVMAGIDDLIGAGGRRPESIGYCRLVLRWLHVGLGHHANPPVQGRRRGRGHVRPGQRIRDRVARIGTIRSLVLRLPL